MRRLFPVGLIVCVAVSSGCASLVRGTSQDISFVTVPPGAEIRDPASGGRWQAPVTISLKRNSRHVLVVDKDGYQPQEVYIRSEANVGWWILDAFSLGVGNALDSAIGGMFDLKPARVYVVLERDS